MNADEAEKCIEKGIQHFKNGDYLNAHKLFSKSLRLNHSEKGFKLLHMCEEKMKENSHSNEDSKSMSDVNFRKSEESQQGKETTGKPSEGAHKNYTQAQVDDIKSMKIKKDFYEILGVAKAATEEEIKKQYKKLALKFHPDKNRAPGADEIFKKIAQAYDCLTNKEKREVYDKYGNESPEEHYMHYRQRYSEDISPEVNDLNYKTFLAMISKDIFSFFFSSAFDDEIVFRSQRRGRNGQAYRNANQNQRNPQFVRVAPYWNLLNFLPFLFIFLSFFAYNGVEEPHYLMERTRKYNTEMKTHKLELSFYVEPSFKDKYKPGSRELSQLEQEIEWSYINNLRHHCKYQTNLKRDMEYRAYYSSKYQQEVLLKKARDIDLSSCSELDKIKRKHGFSITY